MAYIVIYDPADAVVPNRVTQYVTSVSSKYYGGLSNYLKNPSLPGAAVPEKYWKRSGSSVVEMSAGEKTAWDTYLADQAAQAEEDRKDFTKAFDKLQKAQTLVVMDEINVLRAQHSLAARTQAQLKTAIKNKYNSL